MSLHFPWAPCPECDSTDVYDISSDTAPTFEFECRDCGHEWEQAGIGLRLKEAREEEAWKEAKYGE